MSQSGSGQAEFTLSDEELDGLFAHDVRCLSGRHWSPVDIARRAAQMLVTGSARSVLDIGCGPGKFCMVGAMATSGIFVGIDHRAYLIEEGERVKQLLGIDRVTLLHGDMSDLDWSRYDAFYLFNPFHECIAAESELDFTSSVRPEVYRAFLAVVDDKLAKLGKGARVVTYHGFGGELPPSYALEASERAGSGRLNLWVKQR